MATRGRKNRYETYVQPYLKDIEKWISDGATEEIVCKKLGIAVSTFNNYKNEKVELMEVLKRGKVSIVDQLRGALVKAAVGFEYEEQKTYIKTDEEGKPIKYTEITKKVAQPNVAAINLALKNYDRNEWANDPQTLELKRMEFEFKKQMAEKENW